MDFREFAGKALKFTGKAAWFIVSEGGKAIFESIQKTNENRNTYSDYDDHRLERKMSSGSFTEKAAARSVLKERGYSDEEIKDMMKK